MNLRTLLMSEFHTQSIFNSGVHHAPLWECQPSGRAALDSHKRLSAQWEGLLRTCLAYEE